MPPKYVCKTANFSVLKVNKDERIVEGWLTVPVVDSDGEIIDIKEFVDLMPVIMERGGTVVEEHSNKVCGKILEWKVLPVDQTCKTVDGNKQCKDGVWIKVQVYNNFSTDQETWDAILKNDIKGFSFGGHVEGYKFECLKPDAVIYTDTEPKYIKEVRVGDRVLGHDGKYHTVTQTFVHPYEGNLIKVKAKAVGTALALTPNHPIFCAQVMHKDAGRNTLVFKEPRWVRADSVSVKDFVLMPFPKEQVKSKETLQELLDRNRIKTINDTIHVLTKSNNALPFKNVPISNISKLFGYFVAEGSTSGASINIHSDDDVCKDAFNTFNFIGLNAINRDYGSKGYPHCAWSAASSTILAQTFQQLFGRGAANKTFPTWLASNGDFKEFYKGAWLGDGSSHTNSDGSIGLLYDTVSKKLALQLVLGFLYHRIIPTSLFVSKKYNQNRDIVQRHDGYRVCLYGEQADRVAQQWLNIGVKNRRQRDASSWFTTEDYVWYEVSEITSETYNGTVYNLEVDGSNSYIADGIAVHNCEESQCYNKSHGLEVFEVSLVRHPANPLSMLTFINQTAKSEDRLSQLLDKCEECKPHIQQLIQKGITKNEITTLLKSRIEDISKSEASMNNDQLVEELMAKCGHCKSYVEDLVKKGLSTDDARVIVRERMRKALQSFEPVTKNITQGGENMTETTKVEIVTNVAAPAPAAPIAAENKVVETAPAVEKPADIKKDIKPEVIGDALRDLKEVIEKINTRLDDVDKKLAKISPKPATPEKPAEKPAEKPIEKPVEKPAPAPEVPKKEEEEEVLKETPKDLPLGDTDKEEAVHQKEEELRRREEELRRKEEEIRQREETMMKSEKTGDIKKYDPHRDPTDLIASLDKELKKIYDHYQLVKKSFEEVRKTMTDYDPRAASGTEVLGEIKDPVRKKTVQKDEEAVQATTPAAPASGEKVEKTTDYKPRASSDPNVTLGKVKEIEDDIRPPPRKLSEVVSAKRTAKSTQELKEKLAKSGFTVVSTKRPISEVLDASFIEKSKGNSVPTLDQINKMSWDDVDEFNARFQAKRREIR